jgi:hypothetical protein
MISLSIEGYYLWPMNTVFWDVFTMVSITDVFWDFGILINLRNPEDGGDMFSESRF